MSDPDQASQASIDAAVLGELRESMGGDDEFVTELLETYLDDGAAQLAAIEAALAAGDAAALVRPAHTLKSSSATVGAMRLAELCRGLEMTGRSGSIDELDRDGTVGDLRSEWQAVDGALRSWMERLAAS